MVQAIFVCRFAGTFVFIWRFTVQKLLAFSLFRKKSKNTKAVCGLGRAYYGGLWNVRPPIIDPRIVVV